MKKILLIGTHGQLNWGDDILLETFLTQLGNKNEYFVNSYDPKTTEKDFNSRFNITCFHTTKEKVKLLKFLFKCDIVFFAGGTILRELYKSSGRSPYGSLIMVLALTIFAKYIAGKKIIMSNIGAGPLPTKTGRFLAKLALNTTSISSFRDEQSIILARSCGMSKKVDSSVVPDCVFVNDSNFFQEKVKKIDQNNNKIAVGLNLVYDVAKPEARLGYLESLSVSMSKYLSKNNVEIVPIPMQTAFNPHNDIVEIGDFLKKIKIEKEIIAPNSPQDIADIISSCNFVIAARYHTIVISSILGKPTMPLMYDIKVLSLVKRLGILDYSVDINEETSSEDITKKIEMLSANHQIISDSLINKSNNFRTELNTYFDKIRKIIND